MRELKKISSLACIGILSLIVSGWRQHDISSGYQRSPNEDDVSFRRERILVRTDRGKYIAGEQIWLSISTINPEDNRISTLSSLAYVELINPWNLPVIQSRFELTEGFGRGFFQIPDTLSSGTYTLRAYTNHMKNFPPETYFMNDLEIYNAFRTLPFYEKKVQYLTDKEPTLVSNPLQFHGSIVLKSDSIYGRREKVSVKIITNFQEKSTFNVSVVPYGSEATDKGMPVFIIPGESDPERYPFETNGHWLTLQIKYREGTVRDSSDVLFRSVQGKVAEFSYAKRDSVGVYSFLLPVDNKSRNLIIQPEIAQKNMSLEVLPSFSWLLPASSGFTIRNSDSIPGILSQLSFNYQASRIYKVLNYVKSSPAEITSDRKRRFYGIPEMEVRLADYISLPTMQEVFFELLPGIIMKPVKEGYEMRITNPLTGSFYAEPPLVMIDGIIINDLNVLADLNPERVERVEVVKTPYLTGDLILHGIVNVITKTGDFSDISLPDYAVMFPYSVVEEVPDFATPDYSNPEVIKSRTPDLRNTIYWNPSVNTNSLGEAEIEFRTTDLPGKYIIGVQAISGSGKIASVKKTFRVK